jgi:polysaccharide export outer membrane protein
VTTQRLCSAVLVLLLMALTPSAAWAQAADKPAATGAAPAEQNAPGGNPADYRIGPEDILLISVWKNEAVSKTVPVRPDGKISLPLVNDVTAAGLTALELRQVLAKKLAEYIPEPEVSVIVSEVRSFKVSVMGEVAKPARYELKSWTTVLDALALAGGFTPFAARSQVVVLRPEGNGMKRIPFNYPKVVKQQGLMDLLRGGPEGEDNFYLRNGDIIVVP